MSSNAKDIVSFDSFGPQAAKKQPPMTAAKIIATPAAPPRPPRRTAGRWNFLVANRTAEQSSAQSSFNRIYISTDEMWIRFQPRL